MSSLTVYAPKITIMDIAVRVLDGLYSLNDLHRASGENSKHKPANFMRVANTKDLIAEIEQCSDMSNGIKSTAYKIVRGGKIERVGTWVCKDLVYSYAMWISPKFALLVIRTFDKLVTGELKVQPNLANISAAQQHAIRKAVSKKCKSVSSHYQTIYTKLYEHFDIPRYTELLAVNFEDAIRFIDAVDLNNQSDINVKFEKENSYALSVHMMYCKHWFDSVRVPLETLSPEATRLIAGHFEEGMGAAKLVNRSICNMPA